MSRILPVPPFWHSSQTLFSWRHRQRAPRRRRKGQKHERRRARKRARDWELVHAGTYPTNTERMASPLVSFEHQCSVAAKYYRWKTAEKEKRRFRFFALEEADLWVNYWLARASRECVRVEGGNKKERGKKKKEKKSEQKTGTSQCDLGRCQLLWRLPAERYCRLLWCWSDFVAGSFKQGMFDSATTVVVRSKIR